MIKITWPFVITAGVLLLFYNNCSLTKGSFQSSSSGVVSLNSIADNDGPPSIPADPNDIVPCVPSAKLTILRDVPPTDSQIIAKDLPAELSEVTVVADNRCLNKSGQGTSVLSQQIIAQGVYQYSPRSAYHLKLAKNLNSSQLQQMLQEDKCLKIIDQPYSYELNAVNTPNAPNDAKYANETHLSFIKHNSVYPYAFNAFNGINRPIRVAVIDSGLDLEHPDLKANIMTDTAGNRIVYDAITGTLGPITDTSFHGTHVAGLIGAISHNSIGISGVLGKQVQILPVRVATATSDVLSPSVSLDAVVNGVRWAADQNIDVMNLSLGGAGAGAGRPAFQDALKYAVSKGVMVFVSSGNGDSSGVGIELSESSTAGKYYPANWGRDIAGMMTVGSVDAGTQGISSFSNYSSTYVEILSPGSNGSVGILSTVPTNLSTTGYAQSISKTSNGVTRTSPIQGTSMASPVAAGAAAYALGLLRSRNFFPAPQEMEDLMRAASRKVASLSSKAVNGNTLDLEVLTEMIDQQTHASLTSTDLGSAAYGTVKLQTLPSAAAVVVGGAASFAVTLTSDSTMVPQYQWYKNNVAIVGANRPTLSMTSVSTSDAGSYHVQVSAGATKVNTPAVRLTVGQAVCN